MDAQYKIIGGDGREYGPVPLEELRAWIRDGRMAATTQTWRDDLATWAPASSYEEFASDLAGAHVAPAVPRPAELQPVGFWARLAAYIIDAIIISLIFYLVWSIVLAVTGWKIDQFPMPPADMVDPNSYLQEVSAYFERFLPILATYFLVQMFVNVCYDTSLNGRFGATLGKMAIGARIVRVDGSPIGYGTALLRSLSARVVSSFLWVGYLFIAFRQDKRALHDLMVGTKVVFKR